MYLEQTLQIFIENQLQKKKVYKIDRRMPNVRLEWKLYLVQPVTLNRGNRGRKNSDVQVVFCNLRKIYLSLTLWTISLIKYFLDYADICGRAMNLPGACTIKLFTAVIVAVS